MTEPAKLAQLPAYGQETAQLILDIITLDPKRHSQAQWELSDRLPGWTPSPREDYCGTSRCVAGWAYWIHKGQLPVDPDEPDIANEDIVSPFAREALSIEGSDASNLFYCTSNSQAVRALEYLARGESIDWDAVYAD